MCGSRGRGQGKILGVLVDLSLPTSSPWLALIALKDPVLLWVLGVHQHSGLPAALQGLLPTESSFQLPVTVLIRATQELLQD